jgi:hypothetical protein
MAKDLRLIPAPRSLVRGTGGWAMPAKVVMTLPASQSNTGGWGAVEFGRRAGEVTGRRFVAAKGPGGGGDISVRLDAAMHATLADSIRDQSYRLEIRPEGVEIAAPSAAGIFYAFQTLLQIMRAACGESRNLNRRPRPGGRRSGNMQRRCVLPCLTIFDYPDFARRGVYHDTARGKVPKLKTVLRLVEDLAHLKYNEFQLYIENNYEFRRHPEMYDDTDPFTAEELRKIDAHCRERHIDFVPSLTSLGHFEKILSRPRYRPLAEAEPEQLKAIGAPVWHEAGPWSLAVADPGSKVLLGEMYAEFAPNFSSGQFNICCDEAYDLGRVRSKELADKIGTGRMYVDWINFCDTLVKKHHPGASIQMWGDIILNHPELIAQLPPDATLLEWGYEHDHKFEEHCAVFAERLGKMEENKKGKHGKEKSRGGSGRSFYVAPGTSSWLTLSSRTKNACGNIHNAAAAGLKYGARGILVTDWGDHGHQQLLSASLLAFAYGAAAGWHLAATPNPCAESEKSSSKSRKSAMGAVLAAVSAQFFLDPAAQFAGLAYDLGLTYERLGWQRFNASLDHFLFREKWDFANYVNRAPAGALGGTIAAAKRLEKAFKAAACEHPDAEQIREEFLFTCREIVHTCRRTLLRQAWLAADPAKRNPEEEALRNKPPKALPGHFRREMTALRKEVRQLEKEFARLWLARNKRSRLEDVRAEFRRLEKEYVNFAKSSLP